VWGRRLVCVSQRSIDANKKIPWPESASELHRLSDRRLSAKLVTTIALMLIRALIKS
jgi:hypothetical protein